MTYQSKTEINLNRLLCSLEEMVSSKQTNEWRFEKYLSAARTMLHELSSADSNFTKSSSDADKRSLSTLGPEHLRHYRTRMDFLNQVLESSKASSLEDRARLVNSLSSTFNGNVPFEHPPVTPVKEGMELLPKRQIRDRTPELIAKEKGALLNDLRSELFSSSKSAQSESIFAGDDNEARLRRQRDMQANITGDMLGMVRNLKDISRSAGQVIRDDMKVIDKAGQQLDSNMSRLKVETGRLDSHLQSACSWTIWVMIGFVIVFFIGMVLFMKFFSKS